MSYKFYFNNIKDANYFYDRVIEIAENFGDVRLSDLYDLLGKSSDYLSSQVIWNKETILFDVGRDFNPRYGHYVQFPEPDAFQHYYLHGPQQRSLYHYSRSNPAGKRNQRPAGFHYDCLKGVFIWVRL